MNPKASFSHRKQYNALSWYFRLQNFQQYLFSGVDNYSFPSEVCSPFHFLFPSTYFLMNKRFFQSPEWDSFHLSTLKMLPQDPIWLAQKILHTEVQGQATATSPNSLQLYPLVDSFSSPMREKKVHKTRMHNEYTKRFRHTSEFVNTDFSLYSQCNFELNSPRIQQSILRMIDTFLIKEGAMEKGKRSKGHIDGQGKKGREETYKTQSLPQKTCNLEGYIYMYETL